MWSDYNAVIEFAYDLTLSRLPVESVSWMAARDGDIHQFNVTLKRLNRGREVNSDTRA